MKNNIIRNIVPLTEDVYEKIKLTNPDKINLKESLNGYYINFYPYESKNYCDDVITAARNENSIIDFYIMILCYNIYSYKPYNKKSLLNSIVNKTYPEFRKMILKSFGTQFDINKNEYEQIILELIDNTINDRDNTYGTILEANKNNEYKEFINSYKTHIKKMFKIFNINDNINNLL